jgi:hypothetical protein
VDETRAAAVDEESEGPPAPVLIALLASYALGAMLIVFGLIGFLVWADVGEPTGVTATILGLLVLWPTYVAWRGSRIGRAAVGLLAAIGAVAGVVYMFAGPTSAVIPSLVVALLGAGTLALLYVPDASKRFYATR